jgi:glyoxylase-like metal-dependent hydrolase (beta-lactamase superfamily II)
MVTVHTVDLNFMGRKGDIATYLIPHSGGGVLVDPGPESTLPALTAALGDFSFTPHDVTHVLLTHIHLDHAGAAGWFAGQGTQVCVHPVGSPHISNPEKLLASASRLYGEKMNEIWGDMKPVAPHRLTEVQDEADIVAGDVRIRALHTPGHAEHHVSYVFQDVVFSGDVGGVRFRDNKFVYLPFVPPETHLEKWRLSLKRLLATGCNHIAPTHFGIYDDAKEHLTRAGKFLDDVETWLERNMPGIPDVETLVSHYSDFLDAYPLFVNLDEATQSVYKDAGPIAFAASGLFRYWHTVRNAV